MDVKARRLTAELVGVLDVEIREVLLVIRIIFSSFIFSQLSMILMFHRSGPAFVDRLVLERKCLPSFADCLGDFSEAEVFALQGVSCFWGKGQHRMIGAQVSLLLTV